MQVWFILGPFVVLGLLALFVAFSGGPSAARDAYLNRGGRLFSVVVVLAFLVLGVAVPALVISGRGEAEGAVGSLRTEEVTVADQRGKELFIQSSTPSTRAGCRAPTSTSSAGSPRNAC